MAMVVILCVCMVILGLSNYSRSYHTQFNKRYFSRTLPTSIAPKQIATSSSCKLRMKGWWEDDLPNILGINPIEAAIIFGALYYFYGPTVLYDYAREAGKLFSTYAPVVKDVSMDLFYEFREYFEEDKERDELRKLGIDVDSTPRRTTNAIERFQNSFQALTDAETVEEGGTDELTRLLNDPIVQQELNVGPHKRKSKREILEMRNIDVAQVLAASENKTSTGDNVDAALTESITAIQGTITSMVDQRKQASTRRFDDPMTAFKQYNFPDIGQQSTTIGDLPPVLSRNAPRLPAIPNKFQQQMTGEWNQRVMRRDKYDEDCVSSQSHFDMRNSEKDTAWSREDAIDVTPELAEPVRGFDLSTVDLSAMLPTASPAQKTAAILNIPTDIAFDDLADPQTLTGVTIPDMMLPATGVFNIATNTSTVVKSGIDLLAEMDRDYLQLRAKLVAFLTNNATRS